MPLMKTQTKPPAIGKPARPVFHKVAPPATRPKVDVLVENALPTVYRGQEPPAEWVRLHDASLQYRLRRSA